MHRPTRRAFLGSVSALAGAATVIPVLGQHGLAAQAKGGWDFTWLDRLTGKHKQVFELSAPDRLHVINNWLKAWDEVFGLKHPDVNAVLGIASSAFPLNASTALYEAFPIGEMWNLTDPETGKPPVRNYFLDGPPAGPFVGSGVRSLQQRGAIFWQCNNALTGISGRLATAAGRPQPEVYEQLKAGLNPGVVLVPAHTMLIGMSQERGCAYEYL